MKMESQIQLINIEDIIPNRFQPRSKFDENSLEELSTAIQEHGIFLPLVVRRLNEKYELIAGERRLKAAFKAGLKAVPCIITDIDDNESAEVAVIENTQRKNLNPIEEAQAYKKLIEKRYLTQDQLAKRLGMSLATLSNKVRLLSLDEAVQKALLNDDITENHANSLLRLTDKMKQVELLNRVIENNWTVKQLDKVVSAINESYNAHKNYETGTINTNRKFDIDIDNIIRNSTDIESDIQLNDQYYYSYNSGIQDPPRDKTKKTSMFFNNLENESANMDPTLNFGFNPFKIGMEEEDNDYELLDLDEEDDDEEETQVDTTNKSMEPQITEIELERNEDVIVQIKKLLTKARANALGVKVEEFSFDDIYQFVIRVDKEEKEDN